MMVPPIEGPRLALPYEARKLERDERLSQDDLHVKMSSLLNVVKEYQITLRVRKPAAA
jgi:hypothetical protein